MACAHVWIVKRYTAATASTAQRVLYRCRRCQAEKVAAS